MKKLFLAIACLIGASASYAAEKSVDIDSSKLGEDWPLTFNKAKVSCINKRFIFVYNTDTDDRYPVNGNAKTAVQSGKMEGYDIDAVWADDPNYKGVKKSISPILDAGNNLCEQ
ncbi:DUF2511 domain-containing protein [Pantoea agglomerans]|uniref:DUF2511 domain-containing protein n=1 Tax=Enterobacter agglomerans TaxID=549 RepID=UPI00320ACC84